MNSHDTTPSKHAHTSPLPKHKGRSMPGILLTLAGIMALAGLSWYVTHRAPDANAQQFGGPGGRNGPPATTVGVATAERVDLPIMLESLGTVTATTTATIVPQVSGILQQVLYREGQMVKKGQVLAVIDPRPFELALMQAEGQTRRDEASLDAARITLKRYSALLQQDSVARQDFDTQESLVKQLEGTVLTDKANEGTARLNLAYTKISSPIDGRVGLRLVDVGNIVSASSTTGIAVVTAVSPIDVVFTIPQDQVPLVLAEIGNAAQSAKATGLAVSALDRSRISNLGSGYFLAMDNQVDTATGTVKAKARFANDSLSLYPNQFVNAQLRLRTIKDAVVVPVTALRHSGKGDFVYVLNSSDPGNPTVSLRQVGSGPSTVDKVQIVSGLEAGEKVITEGADRLKDGAKVKLPGDRSGAGKRDASASSASQSSAHHRKPESSAP